MTERELSEIQKIRQGDQRALENFLTDKKSLINLASRPYFFKGGDESDLAEEATIGLVTAVMTFDPAKNDNFDAYALTVMKRKIINAVKGMNRFKHSALNDAAPLTLPEGEDGQRYEREPLSEDPIDRYVTEESIARFYDAAANILSKSEYEILKLYLAGYSYREIAARRSASVKDVDNAIYSVKKKIKRDKGLFYDDEYNV